MNKQLIKDIKKGMSKNTIKQELPAGTTPRRYEPEAGVQKHNERIHRESRYVDEHKNLPFSFRKPQKSMGRTAYVQCDKCGNVSAGTTVTVGVICKSCGKFSTVTEIELDG